MTNQGVERGILEDLPPVLQVVVLHAGIIRLDPFRSHGCRRPAIVGPDLETIANPLPGAGHDASAIEQDRDHQAGRARTIAAWRGRETRWASCPCGSRPSHPSFPSCVLRSRLPAREHRPRQIENDPHRRNYRPSRRRPIEDNPAKSTADAVQLSSLPILSGLLRSDVLPLLGHRALHERHQRNTSARARTPKSQKSSK